MSEEKQSLADIELLLPACLRTMLTPGLFAAHQQCALKAESLGQEDGKWI